MIRLGRAGEVIAAWLGRMVSIAVLVLAWESLSRQLASIYVPSIFASVARLPGVLANEQTWTAFSVSLNVVVIGYLLSLALALPLALLGIYSRLARTVVFPMHEFIRYIPVPALVPLALVWLGIGAISKGFLIFVGTYFHLIFLYYEDLRASPSDAEETARTLGLSRVEALVRIVLVESFPRLWDSSRIAFAWAWSYLLVAEVINSSSGVGFRLQQAVRFDQPAILVWLFLIGLLGIAVDGAFRAAGPFLFPWTRESSR